MTIILASYHTNVRFCNTNTTLSAGCPTAVTITIIPDVTPYAPGHVLSCSADGYDPTYTWSGSVNGVNIGFTGSAYILVEGDFDLTCTANVDELTCAVTATGTETGTALGKCQIQHNQSLVKYWLSMAPCVSLLDYFYCFKCLFHCFTCSLHNASVNAVSVSVYKKFGIFNAKLTITVITYDSRESSSVFVVRLFTGVTEVHSSPSLVVMITKVWKF